MFTEKAQLPVGLPPHGENGIDRLVKIDEHSLQKWKDVEGLYMIFMDIS